MLPVTPLAPDTIAARLAELRQRILDATARAARPPGSVELLAVSKGKPASAVREAYEAGQRAFGENYVQELERKGEELAGLPGLVWHAIGALQRNKVKAVLRYARYVQSVDRLELVAELERRAAAEGVRVTTLVEVNVAGEASKSGCAPGEVGPLLDALRASEHLSVRGLMTIPPFFDDPDQARPCFAALRELRDRHGGAAELPELSMGMSGDFEAAILEGSTLVRVGTALFGARG